MIYQSDRVRIDTAAFRVEQGGAVCELEPKAFDLLVYLVRHAGRVVTKQEILDQVWSGVAVTDNALTRVVAQIRRALGDDAREARFVETVPTRGYRWLPAVVEVAEPAAVGVNRTEFSRLESTLSSEPPAIASADAQPSADRRHRLLAYAGAAIVVAALGVVVWTRVTARTAAVPMVTFTAGFPVQLTTESGVHLFPSVSPDGKAVIYASDRSGRFELYVRALGQGAADTPVTRDGMQNVEPAWSPDGQRVAFHSMTRGGIWIMPALGGGARQVSAFGSRPSWSPDGRTLAFQSDPLIDIGPAALNARPGSTIWTVAADGTDAPRQLTRSNHPPGGHATPVWMPDGASIVFLAHEIVSTEFWVARADGSSQWRLLRIPAAAFDPVVTDGGRRLVTSSGGALLYTMPIDPRRASVIGPATGVTMPSVDGVRFPSAVAGERALFSGMTLESQLMVLPIDAATGEAEGPAHPITNSAARRTTSPVVSPDGQWVAYISGARGAKSDVWVMRTEGGGTQQVTTSPDPETRPTWFPDSDALSFLSSRNGVAAIWKTSRTSRHESMLTRWPLNGRGGPDDAQRFASDDARMSPDGTRIAYSAIDRASGREELHVRVLATGDDRLIVSGADGANFPCWSPDGRTIAFEATRDGYAQIGIVAAGGGAVRLITDGRAQHWVHSFSPDGSEVVSADLESGVWNIVATSVADGGRRSLTSYVTPGLFVRYPAWSPRGDAIVFEEARIRSNLWSADLPATER